MCNRGEEPPIVAVGNKGAPLMLTRSYLGGVVATNVLDKYIMSSMVLGCGAFATTRLCIEKGSGSRFACKSIHKKRLEGLAKDWSDVRREMQIMYHLDGHPNMVQLVDAYEDNAYVHLVMELCSGGGILERVMEQGAYCEVDAASIIRSVLEVVAYTHDMGCMHRDIKLDNLMLSDDGADCGGGGGLVKLVDWGFSTFVRPGQKLRGLCGTSYYVAPEVITGSYDERADVWSCGVVLYVLLCARPPFCGDKTSAIFKEVIQHGTPDMSEDPWPSISHGARDAVRRMMTWSAARRPSAREMLQHPWIRTCGAPYACNPRSGAVALNGGCCGCGSGSSGCSSCCGDGGVRRGEAGSSELLSRLRGYCVLPRLKRMAALAIARHLPLDQVRGLRELFDSMDCGATGAISKEDLGHALELRGSKPMPGELDDIMTIADVDGDGRLSLCEFLASTLHQSRLDEEENLMVAFKHFDRDGNGSISPDELRVALAAMGEHGLSDDDIIGMIQAADLDGNGEIDYGEFVGLMLFSDARFFGSGANTASSSSSDLTTAPCAAARRESVSSGSGLSSSAGCGGAVGGAPEATSGGVYTGVDGACGGAAAGGGGGGGGAGTVAGVCAAAAASAAARLAEVCCRARAY